MNMEDKAKKRKALPSFPVSGNKRFFDENLVASSRSVGHRLSSSTINPNAASLPSARFKVTKAKKITIKNFESPTVPENYSQYTWTQLKEAVVAIDTSAPVKTSLEELYNSVEYLCSNKMAKFLYSNFRVLLQDHMMNHIYRILNTIADYVAMETFLNVLCEYWKSFSQQMVMYQNIFLYLDRTYVLQTPGVLSLWELGVYMLRSHIVGNCLFANKIVTGLLDLIENDRKGATVDKKLIKDLLRMLTDLKIYHTSFQTDFLRATELWYGNEGKALIQELELPAYLAHVNKRLSEEKGRLIDYLHYSTQNCLIKCVENKLITEHSKTLLQKGLDQLLEEHRTDDLILLYLMFSKYDGGLALAQLCSSFNAYIKKKGFTIVTHPENDKTMVQEILDFKDEMDSIVVNCFENNVKFVNSQKEAFEYFFQTKTNRPAELIAKFVDSKLRAGNKEATDDELEKLLDRIMVLFRFIQGKDIFEAFYKNLLAKRLLMSKSASVDAEKSMLSKLKVECGGPYTSKLEGMFKDMEVSRELVSAFKNNYGASLSIDLTVNILTIGNWPSYLTATVMMPSFMFRHQERFREYYMQNHSGRKLLWQPTLGHCVLKAHFPSGTKELQVTVFQCIVLVMFNNKRMWTFEEIQQNTGIVEGELRRTLQSLACGRTRVLCKIPKGKDVNNHDSFVYNSKFTNKHFRVKINQIQMKEACEEQSHIHKQVFVDRQYQIDAAIVRIMKTRKTLSHRLLKTELQNQLTFPFKSVALKRRIENLIERAYLERDRDINDQYHYVA